LGEANDKTPGRAAHPRVNSSYQRYLFGSAGSGGEPTWSDSMRGRAGIRLVSRGIVGSLFFALGGRFAGKQLAGYAPTTYRWDRTKPLQALAKGVDVTLGSAIKHSVGLAARIAHSPDEAKAIAERAVQFRNTLNGGLGRSYGAEVVGVTFDFAMASVGDATARNVIEGLDPHTKKTWLVNDKGEAAAPGEKKHVDVGKALKGLGTTAWRIASKNQGEDWFAGISYVFQMKAQRSLLNKAFKGHAAVFDENRNGGIYKLDNAGKIIGDYQLPGVIDLHWRFVGYNWYTLMFREGYDQIATGFSRWKDQGFIVHPQLPGVVHHPLESTGWLARYMTKSFIKANIYMQPAVLFFWPFRAPQSKWRAQAIHPDATTTAEIQDLSRFTSAGPFDRAIYEHYPTTGWAGMETKLSKGLNYIGKVNDYAGAAAVRVTKNWFTSPGTINRFMGNTVEREQLVRNYVNASFSYTPYMWAKAETALRVDARGPDGSLGEMDKAIYKLMHQAAHFQLKDVWSTTKEIAKLGTHFENGEGKDGNDPTSPITPATNPHFQTPGLPATMQTVTQPSIPQTTVQAQGRMRHDPVVLDAANENFRTANDNAAETAQRATGTDGAGATPTSHAAHRGEAAGRADHGWAESVANRPAGGQYFAVPPTRH
jgi:hypothetical protein